jgi:hypothetical protein
MPIFILAFIRYICKRESIIFNFLNSREVISRNASYFFISNTNSSSSRLAADEAA